MLSSLLALIFVLGLLGGALVILRRWGRPAAKGHHLEVVETVTLGPGKSLSMVAVGPRRLLLAATNDRITLVGELAAGDLNAATNLPEKNDDAVPGFGAGARLPTGYLHSLSSFLLRGDQRGAKARAASRRT